MTRSGKDALIGFGVFVVMASLFLIWVFWMNNNGNVRQCEYRYKEHIDTWTDQQKSQSAVFCQCVADHPVSEISDDDLNPRESRILRQTAFDTCFAKTMVF